MNSVAAELPDRSISEATWLSAVACFSLSEAGKRAHDILDAVAERVIVRTVLMLA